MIKLLMSGALLSVIYSSAWAYDCSTVKPFVPSGQQDVKVTVARYIWQKGRAGYEDVCTVASTIHWYDVRSREEEAYYCLKPSAAEVISCKTKLNKEAAQIDVLPASWLRSWGSGAAREYRFHAYIVKEKDPGYYYDIFARGLLLDLGTQSLLVEGSLKTGPDNPDDGFWIRVEFQK